LDAYSRAIRLNPYLSEVWYDLGTLYESCNQIQDSLDAYQRAAELDPGNKHIQQRLSALRAAQNNPKGVEADAKETQANHDQTPMTLVSELVDNYNLVLGTASSSCWRRTFTVTENGSPKYSKRARSCGDIKRQ
jgi:tetratricopeptide (TPR) repeat protein